MSEKFIIDVENIKKEIDSLEQMLNDINILYADTKKSIEDSRNTSRGSYKFTSDQTKNLIDINNQKITIYKSINDIKIKIEELRIKEVNINAKNTELTDQNNRIIKELFNRINNLTDKNLINMSYAEDEEVPEDQSDIISEEDFDSLLQQVEDEEKTKKDIVDPMGYLDNMGYRIVINDADNSVILVDNDYNFVEIDSIENDIVKEFISNINITDRIEDDGEMYAIYNYDENLQYQFEVVVLE